MCCAITFLKWTGWMMYLIPFCDKLVSNIIIVEVYLSEVLIV